jgi:hypothetical protein
MNPRERHRFVVFGFASTHDAMAAEWLLKQAVIPVTPMPSPPAFGSLCGLAMRVLPEDEDRATNVLSEGKVLPVDRAEIEDL